MEWLGEGARYVHVLFGAAGLAAFWIPVFARKGAVNHVRFGKLFVWCAYIVLGSAALALTVRFTRLALDGVGPTDRPLLFGFLVFLAYLTFVTYVTVKHGVGVLRNKQDPQSLRTPLNVGLAWAAIAASVFVILYAILMSAPNKILLFALSPIGFGTGLGNLRYMRGDRPSKRAWMYEHIGAMLGGGIAFHTAFAVFGATRLFDIGLTGPIAIIPWIAPAAIGIPAIALWTRYYRRKFGELA